MASYLRSYIESKQWFAGNVGVPSERSQAPRSVVTIAGLAPPGGRCGAL